MSRRKGDPKAGAAGLGVIALIVAACCGVVTSSGDKPPSPPDRTQVVEVTTAAVAPTTEEVSESEPVEEPTVDTGDDDDAPVRGVHPGAYCSPEGAYGLTSAGTRMRCKGPGRARWRRA